MANSEEARHRLSENDYNVPAIVKVAAGAFAVVAPLAMLLVGVLRLLEVVSGKLRRSRALHR